MSAEPGGHTACCFSDTQRLELSMLWRQVLASQTRGYVLTTSTCRTAVWAQPVHWTNVKHCVLSTRSVPGSTGKPRRPSAGHTVRGTLLRSGLFVVAPFTSDDSKAPSAMVNKNFTLICEKQLTESNWTIYQYTALNNWLSKKFLEKVSRESGLVVSTSWWRQA